jgi:hypothetical protein
MNYLEFVDSLTVREHLHSIAYKPDSLSLAYIIWQSKSKTLEEKRDAFAAMIETEADMPIPACEFYGEEPSLFEYLRRYNETQKRHIDSFLSNSDGGVYDYAIYYASPDNAWVRNRALYTSFDKARAAILAELCDDAMRLDGEESLCKQIQVRKRIPDSEDDGALILFTPELLPFEYEPSSLKITDEDYDTLTRLMGVCRPIPHPFKAGDTVRECAGKYALPPDYADTLTVSGFYTEEYVLKNAFSLGMHSYVLFGKSVDEDGVSFDTTLDHYLSVERI